MRRKSRVRRSETAGVDSRRLNPSSPFFSRVRDFSPRLKPGEKSRYECDDGSAKKTNRLFSIKNRLITNPEVTVETV